MKKIEYRVRPVTRYIITRYYRESRPDGYGAVGSDGMGEFDNLMVANGVCRALSANEPGSESYAAHTSECSLSQTEEFDEHRQCDCGAQDVRVTLSN